MIVKDRNGNEVYRTKVRVNGKKSLIGGDRAKTGGDTPTGTYKILEWRASDNDRYSRKSFGPNDLLALSYQNGEAEGKRQHMHIHGGRQEEFINGKWSRKSNPTLWNTFGCFRIDDKQIKEIKEITDELENNDPLEKGGELTLEDDLVDKNGEYVYPNDKSGKSTFNNAVRLYFSMFKGGKEKAQRIADDIEGAADRMSGAAARVGSAYKEVIDRANQVIDQMNETNTTQTK